MADITDIRMLDSNRIKLLIDCSIQAYNAFNAKQPAHCHREGVIPPDGFELLDSWSGVDSVFGQDKTIETYGLVFRSIEAPWRYIFAFRGTDDALDMLDDCGVEPQEFVPFETDIGIPDDVRVESGFNDIYRTPDDATGSMQQQLFTLIDKYQTSANPISEIHVTGHSLGAALSQLFTLDLALSRPGIPTSNINFASPRVGNKSFVSFYETVSQDTTLRVHNQYDAVPHLPPAELGFEHTPAAYIIAFYSEDLLGKVDLKASHSCTHYQAALICASESDDGVCVRKELKPLDGTYTICSLRPEVNSAQHIVDKQGMHG